MKIHTTLCCAVLLLLSNTVHAAGDARAGKSKASMCMGCHQIPGYEITYPVKYAVPKLIGQHPEYIVSALQAYQKGDRNFSTMRAIAGSLSDQDMEDLAAYYASMTPRGK